MAEWHISSYLSLKHQDICWAHVLLHHASPLALPLGGEADVPCVSWLQGPGSQRCTWISTPWAPWALNEKQLCARPPPICLGWLHEKHAVLQARSQRSLFSGLWSMPLLVFHHIRLRAPVGCGHPLERSLVFSLSLPDSRPDCVLLRTHFGWMRGVCSD